MIIAPDIWFYNLGIELFNVRRIAFSVFGINIYMYGILIPLGVAAGYITALIEAKRTGQKKEDYSDLLVIGIISAIIGLRLFFVIFNLDLFIHNPITIITGIRGGGLAIFGGIISSIAAVYFFARKRKLNVWRILDTCAPSFAIGQAVGRWGNFFNREAFGGFTDNIFAMRIISHQATGRITPEISANTIMDRGVEYIQVHPTFLYESFFCLILFAALTFYRPRKNFEGEVFFLYLLGYGVIRFFVEGLRTDQLLLGAIPVSQLSALIIFIAALTAIPFIRIQGRKKIKP